MLKKVEKICRKKGKRQIGRCAAVAVILCWLMGAGQFSFCVNAAQADAGADTAAMEENGNSGALEQGIVLEAEKSIEMKASPEKTAETVMTFQKGDLIFAVGEAKDGWYRVNYQGNEGYVEDDGLTVREIDIEGLNAEMAANEEETKFVVEVVERYRADARRSKIWGTVIIVLVVGIFGVGIFSAVRGSKNETAEQRNETKRGRNTERSTGGNPERNEEKMDGSSEKKSRKKEAEQIEIEDLN